METTKNLLIVTVPTQGLGRQRAIEHLRSIRTALYNKEVVEEHYEVLPVSDRSDNAKLEFMVLTPTEIQNSTVINEEFIDRLRKCVEETLDKHKTEEDSNAEQ